MKKFFKGLLHLARYRSGFIRAWRAEFLKLKGANHGQ